MPLAPRTIVVGLRLRPGALPAVLGPPADALADRDTPLEAVWGKDAMVGRIADQRSIEARLTAAEAALAARLSDAGPPDPTVVAATGWLACRPAGRVEDLAALLEIGPRRLHRRFRAAVGYGPKRFQRVLRLQRVLALAGRGRPGSLAALALDAGYADQAHMSREVRELTGRSPSALLGDAQSTLALSDLFKTEAAPTL